MLSRALDVFAGSWRRYLAGWRTVLAVGFLALPAFGQVLVDGDHASSVLVAQAEVGATALNWYARTTEAQPVAVLSVAQLKRTFLALTGGTMTGQIVSNDPVGSAPFASFISLDPTARTTYGLFVERNASATRLAICLAGTASNGSCLNSISVDGSAIATFSSAATATALTASNGRVLSRNANGGFSFGVSGTAYIDMQPGQNFIDLANSGIIRVDNPSGSYIRNVAVASGALPTCDAAHTNAIYFTNGTIVSDAVFCNGVAWESFGVLTAAAYYDGNTTAANTPITGFNSFYAVDTGASFGKLDVTITRLGTDGTHNATWRVQNTSTATTVCTNTFLCNHAVGRIEVACTAGSAIQFANVLEVQVDESACTGTVPLGNALWIAR